MTPTITLAAADEAAALGALWAPPGSAWEGVALLRPWDGVAVLATTGREHAPRRAAWAPRGPWVLSLPGRSVGLATALAGALGVGRAVVLAGLPADAPRPSWATLYQALVAHGVRYVRPPVA